MATTNQHKFCNLSHSNNGGSWIPEHPSFCPKGQIPPPTPFPRICFLSCSLPNQNLIWFVEPRSHAYTLVAKESRKESKFLAFGEMGFMIRGNPTNTGKLIKDTGDHKAWQMFPILYVVFLNTNWIIFWISSAWHTIGTQLMRKEKKKKEGRHYTITCCLTKTGRVKTLRHKTPKTPYGLWRKGIPFSAWKHKAVLPPPSDTCSHNAFAHGMQHLDHMECCVLSSPFLRSPPVGLMSLSVSPVPNLKQLLQRQC